VDTKAAFSHEIRHLPVAQWEAQVPTHTDEDDGAFVMPPEERIGGPNGHRLTLPQSDSGFSQHNPYGPYESIVSNCHVRVAFTPNQQETCELLSKMTGTQTIQKATYNFSGKRTAPVMNHINASVENVERPLMTPDEVSRLKAAKKRGKDAAERIVAPGKMLIFVGGQHPILGTQMLYFRDPTLKAWSEIPPPTKLVSIQGGNIVPLPVTLKVNRSTKKAKRQPEDAELLTEIETAFIEWYREQREVYDYAD